jgi:hypothetical protein
MQNHIVSRIDERLILPDYGLCMPESFEADYLVTSKSLMKRLPRKICQN